MLYAKIQDAPSGRFVCTSKIESVGVTSISLINRESKIFSFRPPVKSHVIKLK
jgi:hypothetical protein